MTEKTTISKRDFLRKTVLTGAGAAGATMLATPYVKAQAPIKWRLQTYAGPALAEHVIQNSIGWFNKAANGEMEIELYTADQLVPQGELFRAVQSGTIDAAQSDDDSAAAPVDVKVFGAYFPLASRYSLDVPALWHWHGLKEIWEEAYKEIPGVTWLSTGAWDPCNFGTTKPIKSLADLQGLRVYTFPTGGQFLSKFGCPAPGPALISSIRTNGMRSPNTCSNCSGWRWIPRIIIASTGTGPARPSTAMKASWN